MHSSDLYRLRLSFKDWVDDNIVNMVSVREDQLDPTIVEYVQNLYTAIDSQYNRLNAEEGVALSRAFSNTLKGNTS